MDVCLIDEIEELRRELALRAQCYPLLVELGVATQAEVDWRQACLQAALRRLEAQRE